jgi:hypothetical protein
MRDGPNVESSVGDLIDQTQLVALTSSGTQEKLAEHVRPETPPFLFSSECDSSGALSGS